MQLFLSRQFGLFLLTGGIAAAVNLGSRVFYNQWMSFSAAVIVAYLSGMATAFILARLFVFKHSQHSTARSALLFALVNLVAMVQTWFISVGIAYYLLPALHWQWHNHELAHLIGVVVPVFTSYIGHKRWSFR